MFSIVVMLSMALAVRWVFLKCPSVALFVDRAQAVAPDFQVTRANAASIAQLCASLEGIPLSLELAAARTGVLSPAQMLEAFDARLEWLVTRENYRPARHRSLRAALECSAALLSPELRRFFAQLSVFRGGWTSSWTICGPRWPGHSTRGRPGHSGRLRTSATSGRCAATCSRAMRGSNGGWRAPPARPG